MNTQAENNVNFYESQKDMGRRAPYAVMSARELDAIMKRLVSWATVLATHPKLAESFGELKAAHIQQATYLRSAMHKSVRVGIFPNVVLPEQDFTATLSLIDAGRQVQPELSRRIDFENQRWVYEEAG